MYIKTYSKIASVQALVAAHAVLFTFLATRFLSPDEFGELRYVLVLLPFLMVVTLPTFDIIVLRETASRSKISLQGIVYKKMQFGLCGAILFAIVLMLIKDFFSFNIFLSLCLIIIILPFYEITTPFRNFLVGKGLRERALMIQLRNRLISIMIMLSSLLIFLWLEPSVTVFLFIFLVSTTLPNIITNLKLKIRESSCSSKYIKPSGLLTREAVLTSIASIIWTASYSIDRIIVERKMGFESLALYSILVMVPFMLAQYADSVVMIYYKKIFVEKDTQMTIRCGTIIFCLIFSVITAYGYFVHLFYPTLFGHFYKYPLSLALLSGCLIFTGSIELLFIQYLYSQKKTKLIFSYNIASISILAVTFTTLISDMDIFTVLLVLVLKQFCLPVIIYICNMKLQCRNRGLKCFSNQPLQ